MSVALVTCVMGWADGAIDAHGLRLRIDYPSLGVVRRRTRRRLPCRGDLIDHQIVVIDFHTACSSVFRDLSSPPRRPDAETPP